MNTKTVQVPAETWEWLLDPDHPGPRYLALLKLSRSADKELQAAGRRAHEIGPIRTILDAMHPGGYWEGDGPGYLPKYRASAWSLILLSQLGAKVEFDPRINLACEGYLDRAMTGAGQISSNGNPSGTIDCLQGNILAAMALLEYKDDRLQKGFEWMARTTTGESLASREDRKAPLRYYAGKCGPDFQCGANNKLACAWGATKVMLAFSKLSLEERTPLIDRAIQRGLDFLLSRNPGEADYPCGWSQRPSRNWWKFGFPVFYVTDILQICEALIAFTSRDHPGLEDALDLVKAKVSPEGRCLLEYDYRGKTWLDFGAKHKPNKWVTIRALSVLGAELDSERAP